MNFVGFYFYTCYNIYGFWWPASDYHGETHWEDVAFAIHALFFVSIQLVQYWYYPKGTNKINWGWVAFTAVTVIGVVVTGLCLGGPNELFYWMGIGKVIITFVKYTPQVYLNFKRKSTFGWSIENIFLDFTGGSLSFIQIFMDWINTGNTSQFSGGLNVAKFLLGIISMFFDVIFMVQHFCLYGGNKKRKSVRASFSRPSRDSNMMDGNYDGNNKLLSDEQANYSGANVQAKMMNK